VCPADTLDPLARAQPLLNSNTLIKASVVLADRTIIPEVGGVYGWW